LIFLEINTQPGMTGTSLVPELAGHSGLTFGELVRWIVEDASCNR
jgi:D-alanine-D-alanine ligase